MNLTSDQLNLIFTVLATLVVAALFFYFGLTAKRPKLRAGGSGSGGVQIPNRDVMASSITVRNQRTVWGIKTPRETARIESARVFDPALRECVGPVLKWRTDGNELSRTAEIAAGKQANVYVFAKDRYDEDHFIFDATALNADLPEQLTRFRAAKKDYIIVLSDDLGREYRFAITARNGQQSVGLSFKVTFRNRWEMLREGVAMIWRAVTPQRS